MISLTKYDPYVLVRMGLQKNTCIHLGVNNRANTSYQWKVLSLLASIGELASYCDAVVCTKPAMATITTYSYGHFNLVICFSGPTDRVFKGRFENVNLLFNMIQIASAHGA